MTSKLAIHEAGHICADIYLGAESVSIASRDGCIEVSSEPLPPPQKLVTHHMLGLMGGAVAEVITAHRDYKISSVDHIAALAPIWAFGDLEQVRLLQAVNGWTEPQVLGFFAAALGIISEDVVIKWATYIDPVIDRLRDGESEVVFHKHGVH